MVILGLTGSIGMGKSAVSGIFRRLGVLVYDADKAVHEAQAGGGAAAAAIEAAFPGVAQNGIIDRQALAERVIGDEAALKRLEDILHPVVRRRERQFLRDAALRKCPLVVLEIPLLFETGGQTRCDAVIVVSAPSFVQEARVLARPGMTRERLAFFRSRQMPDAVKRQKADFVIATGAGRAFTWREVKKIVKMMRGVRGSKWLFSGKINA
ncbi:MAG: dephospho-CoA kinase [Rhodospirillales bacterium RIFCSPLOWO2_12_FULL_58_28]|nr:MAG: dephospho-CoA kinase [Rhodospirillales bacterium RIFCSPLOWO2_02_FULL_58_16]OHC79860.1 MAG: dephospho-CoA kinase [Rhodospirillales bacterium RIFCSPLOWO2_12_FULL_58_28]